MSLSIIHLSDIHITGKNDEILNKITALKNACTNVMCDSSDVVVAITGDIAFSGNIAQYEIADNIISDICDHIKNEIKANVYVEIVPGNHDCDIQKNSVVRDTLVKNISENVDEEYYNHLSSAQSNFYNFAKKYGTESNSLINTNEIEAAGERILFVNVNTAWMSVLNENPGNIIMPKALLHNINRNNYRLVVALMHHPSNWLNPDCNTHFIEYIRQNVDMLFVGHEHKRDSYKKQGDSFSFVCNQGKELQDNNSSESAFSVIRFDEMYQSYTVYDFQWKNDKYIRHESYPHPFSKNVSVFGSVFTPNIETIEKMNDLGIVLNHFSKEEVFLSDLYVWPYLNKFTYKANKKSTEKIKSNIFEELQNNSVSIITGSASSGKSSFAKKLFLEYKNIDKCCIFLDAVSLTNCNNQKINDIIDNAFVQQYSESKLNDFRSIPKEKRVIIVDNLDMSNLNSKKRNIAIDIICNLFGKAYFFVSSEVEIPVFFSSKMVNEMSELVTYDILPFGNRKRRELISKWYYLNENNRENDEIEKRIDVSEEKINTILGNGAGFMPAWPVFILSVLQNIDAATPTYNGSQYGYLYETLIQKNLASIDSNYTTGNNNIIIGIVSQLAFNMLLNKKKTFSEDELADTIDEFNKSKKVSASKDSILRKMQKAKIFYQDVSEGDSYKFRYPYIFYYFAGRYIAYHIDDKNVIDIIDDMSGKLYIEDYGNIMIFVCHFANNKEVIESVLLNAYCTLDSYPTFDFTESDSVLSDISAAIVALIPETIGSNYDVENNKNRQLSELDDAGINDGSVRESEAVIDEDVSEKDLAALSAAFKTLDVLGQILQNYPGDVDGDLKVKIINELHSLGMRAVQVIIQTVESYQQDLVQFIIERSAKEHKYIKKEEVENIIRKLLDMFVSGMVRGMINKVAVSLNSPYLLPAVQEALKKDNSISAKLILTELEVNCLNKFDLSEILSLKKELEDSKMDFASCILSSIMSYYLSYNKCNYRLRGKICSKFGFSEKNAHIENQKNLLEQNY